MSDLRFVAPGTLRGPVTPPWSKSQLHRLLIAAFLTGANDWEALVWPTLTDDQEARLSDDIQVTRAALHNMGKWLSNPQPQAPVRLFCGESGTTLRLLVSIAAALGIDAIFEGADRLAERPLSELVDQLVANGITIEYLSTQEGYHLPLHISGQLQAGDYLLPGHISSQYISGLLFALPLLDGDSTIRLSTPLASESYVDLTRDVCVDYGIHYREATDDAQLHTYTIPGGQNYTAPDQLIAPEADYSQAAFWLVAQYLGSPIDVAGLKPDSSQGDKEVLPILERFRSNRADPQGSEEVLHIDISDIPDVVPVLSLAAAATPAEIRFSGVSRLRIKESDRLEASLMILRSVGADQAYAEGDELVIPDALTAFYTDPKHSYSCLNDHRIAMSLAIAAIHSDKGLTLEGSHCVTKSYPDFFEELDRLRSVTGKDHS